MLTKKYLDDLTYEIIGGAIEVHKIMGRGLLESVYHQCLKEELKHRKINFLTEMKIPVIYKGKILVQVRSIRGKLCGGGAKRRARNIHRL